MPALNEQAYEPAKPQWQVQRTDQVFLIRFTGEVFPEYEYVQLELCKNAEPLRIVALIAYTVQLRGAGGVCVFASMPVCKLVPVVY